MRTLPLNIIVLLLLIPVSVFSGEIKKGKYTKEKKIHKAYIVNSNAMLDVANKFGNIYVTTWDEDKTDINVVITVSGNNEEKVDKRLNSIDVEFNAFKHNIGAVTKIGSGSYNNTSMEINYTIKIPVNGSITLHNQYGGIVLSSINAPAVIKCSYGSVKCEKLNDINNNISLAYCEGNSFNFIKNGNLNVQYSDLAVNKAGSLYLDSKYSDITLGEIDDIKYETEYGDLKIRKADVINGRGKYMGFEFGIVTKMLNMTANYGNIEIDTVEASTKNVTINSTYTNIDIGVSQNYAFDYEFSFNYANLNTRLPLTYVEKQERNTSSYFKGYYKKSGVNKMYINSEYGNLNLDRH